jgi:hypothetical protein
MLLDITGGVVVAKLAISRLLGYQEVLPDKSWIGILWVVPRNRFRRQSFNELGLHGVNILRVASNPPELPDSAIRAPLERSNLTIP